jgi:hypothetical protein
MTAFLRLLSIHGPSMAHEWPAKFLSFHHPERLTVRHLRKQLTFALLDLRSS